MTTFKKLAVLALSACTALALSGCANSEKNESSAASNSSDAADDMMGGYFSTADNRTIRIYNAEDKEIGSFECLSYLDLVNGSVLYTRVPESVSGEENVRDFYLYNIDKAENHKLGTVKVSPYETYSEHIEADGHLYMNIGWGDPFAERENCGTTFYDIDLSEYSMTPILTIKQGYARNSYTIANNKLIVAEVLQHAQTDLVEYDLSEKHSSPIVHEYDESDYFTEDAIRHIDADDSNIYMLRLVSDKSENTSSNFATSYAQGSSEGQALNGSNKVSLYLDVYDFDYKLKSSVEISDFCVSTDFERTEDSKINEWKQAVRHFFVHNGLVYYENFSTTNAIGEMKSGNVERLFEIDSRFRYVRNTEKSSGDLFIQIYGRDESKRNTFYLVDPETHEVKTAKFFAPDERRDFFSAMRGGDKILLTMGHLPNDSSDVRLPERLYYLDMNDLDFKAAE